MVGNLVLIYSAALSGAELDASRAAPDIEIAFRALLGLFPFQKDGLRAPLAADEADGLSLDNLSFRVDARARPVTETVPDDLGEVPHEFVVVFEPIASMPVTLPSSATPIRQIAAGRD